MFSKSFFTLFTAAVLASAIIPAMAAPPPSGAKKGTSTSSTAEKPLGLSEKAIGPVKNGEQRIELFQQVKSKPGAKNSGGKAQSGQNQKKPKGGMSGTKRSEGMVLQLRGDDLEMDLLKRIVDHRCSASDNSEACRIQNLPRNVDGYHTLALRNDDEYELMRRIVHEKRDFEPEARDFEDLAERDSETLEARDFDELEARDYYEPEARNFYEYKTREFRERDVKAGVELLKRMLDVLLD